MPRTLKDIFFFGNLIKRLDNKIEEVGFQRAMVKVITYTSTRIKTHNKTVDVINILRTKPAILVANHPAESDVIALIASLCHRQDLHLVINSSFLHICPNLSKHLIPVYVHHRNTGNLRLRLLNLFHQTQEFPKNKAHQKNISSIAKASQKINQGSLVIIFPAGGGYNRLWFNGIGHLITNLKNSKDVYLIMAYIQGTSVFDYLRLLPGLGKIFPPITIHFAAPKIINNLINQKPKAIVRVLNQQFEGWRDSIDQRLIAHSRLPQVKFTLPKNAYLFARSIIFWLITKH